MIRVRHREFVPATPPLCHDTTYPWGLIRVRFVPIRDVRSCSCKTSTLVVHVLGPLPAGDSPRLTVWWRIEVGGVRTG